MTGTRWITLTAAGVMTAVVLGPTFTAVLGTQQDTAQAYPSGGWSLEALQDIPPDMLALYERSVTRCPGMSMQFLAAVIKVESEHGANPGPSDKGAMGPAQFMPGTWRTWGVDGNGDGRRDPWDAQDAIPAAVDYLCYLGGKDPATYDQAAFLYNHGPAAAVPKKLLADDYVQKVLTWMARYTSAVAAVDPAQAGALLGNPNIQIYPGGQTDIANGVIDQRVIAILFALAERYPPIYVNSLKTGHSRLVDGTNRVSFHYYGRAADISILGGVPVSPRNPYARDAAAWLATLSGPERPTEVGSPFPEFNPIPGWFSNRAHMDHLHVGYGPPS